MSGSMMQQPPMPQQSPQMQGAQGAPVQMPMQSPMQQPAPQSSFGGSQIAYQPPPAPAQMIPPPMGAPNPQQNMAMFGRAASGAPGGPGQMRLTPQELAAMGRLGDTTIAHLTPGEIAVPPQVQTPQVKAALGQAFGQVGVSPAQFTAGSPASSVNPRTGVPEYSLWASLLPVLGAAAGSFIPGIGTAAGMALGGAAGGAAGAALDGGNATQALLAALGGGAGGALGAAGGIGSLIGDAGSAAASGATEAATDAATSAATSAAVDPAAAMAAVQPFGPGFNPELGSMATGALAPVANPTPVAASPSFWSQIPWRGAMYAGGGAGLASALAPQPKQESALPASFTRGMTPLNRNYNSILGNSNNPYPSYNGYDPLSSASSRVYDFYAPRPTV